MRLEVNRRWFSETATVGELWVDGKFFCYTCEDRIRAPGLKVKGETAIPEGEYTVVLSFSPRFGRLMPEIQDVPGFVGIRIHSGVGPHHTEGCLCVGEEIVKEWETSARPSDILRRSRAAFDRLFKAMLACHRTMRIRFTNVDPPAGLLEGGS